MVKTWTLSDFVALPFSWCRLTVYAGDRQSFILATEALGLDLPRGWKKTKPTPYTDHSCGRDDLPHVWPLDGPGEEVVGTADAIVRVLEAADLEPTRGPSYWRLAQAVAAIADVGFCTRPGHQ